MRKLVSLLLLAAMVLMLGGCAAKDEWETMLKVADKMVDVVEDEQLRTSTQQMLDGILEDDFEGTYAQVSNFATWEDYEQVYPKFRELLSGIGEYTLTASYKSNNINNGVASVSVRYMLTSGQKRILVEATRVEGYEGLAGFHMYAYTPVRQTGTLASMKGADAAQWILLVVGVLEMGFVLWMFIDCCCHKMKRKWLWLLLTGLGMVAWSLTVQNGLRMNVNVGLFFNIYTALIRYSTGGFTLRLMLPVGAVVYAAMRKKLFRDYENSLQQPMQLGLSPEFAPEPEVSAPAEEPQADSE